MADVFLTFTPRKKPAIRVEAVLAKPPGPGGGEVAEARRSELFESDDSTRVGFGGDLGGSGDRVGETLPARSTGFRSGDRFADILCALLSEFSAFTKEVDCMASWLEGSKDILLTSVSVDCSGAGTVGLISSTARAGMLSGTTPFGCSSFTIGTFSLVFCRERDVIGAASLLSSIMTLFPLSVGDADSLLLFPSRASSAVEFAVRLDVVSGASSKESW